MEVKLIVTQTSNSFALSQREIKTNPELEAMSPIFIIPIIFSAIAILTSIHVVREWQHRQSLKSIDRKLCHGCQYFNSNHYLQCALQPKIVMTEQSIDCRDYSPILKVKQMEKISKVFLGIRKIFIS